jgi:cystathionine gamma-synthase/O-acetylhomoserine (thiol)-lyase
VPPPSNWPNTWKPTRRCARCPIRACPATRNTSARELFRGNAWLLSFELYDAAQTNTVLNALQVPIKATGLGDTPLVIPVASTIFWEAGPEKRKEMDIPDGMVRVSVGLEEAGDLIADFEQAFASLG